MRRNTASPIVALQLRRTRCIDWKGNAKDCAVQCLNPLNWGGKGPRNVWKPPKGWKKPPNWKDYPKKQGREEKHHRIPKYTGGEKDVPTHEIDAEYHQNITNEWRDRAPYGKGPLSPEDRESIAQQIEKIYPLPPAK